MINKIKTHTFQHGAMSIIQMGEELIGHPSTALNELVKNGYDADANIGKVYLHYHDDIAKSFAIIFDDGSGMDDKTLFGDWLQPSFSSKRKSGSLSSIYKRHYLGSKGIGRLAAMALGRYATVVTKTESESSYNWITVDREAFKKDILLSQIHFPGDKAEEIKAIFSEGVINKVRRVPSNDILIKILGNNELLHYRKGTLIVIESLDKSVINILQEDFPNQLELFGQSLADTQFYRSLATLITPLNLSSKIQKELLAKKIISKKIELSEQDSGFAIKFGTNLLPDQDSVKIEWQEVEPIPILSVFDYRVFGKVNRKGDVKGYFIYNRVEGDFHEENFEIPFSDIQENGLTSGNVKKIRIKRKDRTDVGEYYFDIRVYDIGERDNLDKLAVQANLGTANKFREAFKKFQGLRVSKNGFGVKPYGEELDDWIGLSKARVQDPGHNVNTNQILGYVFFYSPENNELQEKTNREGFADNTAFSEVENTLLTIFRNIGRRRYNYRLMHGLGRFPKSKHTRPDVQTFLDEINENDDIFQIREYSEKFMKDVTTAMDNLEESLTFSERLASLGTGIELVYHEIAQPISHLGAIEPSLYMKRDKIQENAKEDFLVDIKNLADTTKVLSELRDSLEPAIGRSRKKKFKPYETFLKVCSLYKSDFNDYNIIPKADKRLSDYEIINQEYAFWIAFLNIINNAVYWIKKSGQGGEIRFHMEDHSFVVSNSGPLIVEDLIEHIFEYGVTTKTEKNATGLGLSFTRSILSTINWEITAENRNNGPAFIVKEAYHE